MTFDELTAALLSRPAPVRLVAVDGPGGAGKGTFAARLARSAAGAVIVHTDDFASWDEPLGWWPRLLEQVIDPLVAGHEGRFQRFDWSEGRLVEWVTVERAPIVISEGVSSGRKGWSHHLAYTVFVDAPEPSRLRRGLDRDGDHMVDHWRSWMASEEDHFTDDHPTVEHNPKQEFVVLACRRS